MKTVEIFGGTLLCDLEATQHAYVGHESYALTCTCIPCKNYLAVSEKYFPRPATDTLRQLGIDFKRDIEVYHVAKVEGMHLYGVWFYFVGSISKEPAYQDSIAFLEGGKWLPASFKGKPLVTVDIQLKLPWEIALEEPVG